MWYCYISSKMAKLKKIKFDHFCSFMKHVFQLLLLNIPDSHDCFVCFLISKIFILSSLFWFPSVTCNTNSFIVWAFQNISARAYYAYFLKMYVLYRIGSYFFSFLELFLSPSYFFSSSYHHIYCSLIITHIWIWSSM